MMQWITKLPYNWRFEIDVNSAPGLQGHFVDAPLDAVLLMAQVDIVTGGYIHLAKRYLINK